MASERTTPSSTLLTPPDATPGTVWIGGAGSGAAGVAGAIQVGVDATGRRPSRGERWAVKLNLTYPEYLPGVVNAPRFIQGLCGWARDCGVGIVFIEGDGGNGTYSADDAFSGNGVHSLVKRYGMACVSLSEEPWEWRETSVRGRTVRLPYSPFFGRRDYDRLITAPLFKNHVFTVVSLGMKNLWGCIPDAYRMYYHHVLDAGIVALCKELRPDFSIFDGLVGLRGRGPMDGKPVEMGAIMVSGGVGAGEAAALAIMGIPLDRVRHLRLAREEGLMPSPEEVAWSSAPQPFKRSDFILDRAWLNRASILLARMPRLQRLVYHSAFSRVIYAVVNRLRRNSPQAELVRSKLSKHYSTIGFRGRSQ